MTDTPICSRCRRPLSIHRDDMEELGVCSIATLEDTIESFKTLGMDDGQAVH